MFTSVKTKRFALSCNDFFHGLLNGIYKHLLNTTVKKLLTDKKSYDRKNANFGD